MDGPTRGVGAPLISPTNPHFIVCPESVKILGVQGVLCMWQLVFAWRHCLIYQEQEQQEEEHAILQILAMANIFISANQPIFSVRQDCCNCQWHKYAFYDCLR